MSRHDLKSYTPKFHEGIVPPQAALVKDPSDIEDQPYKISFFNYKENLCQIRSLNQSCSRKLLEILKNIGLKCKEFDDLKNRSGLNMKHVQCRGEYSGLFRYLSEDVRLYEHYLSDQARLFYFVAPSKVFEVVAIRNQHYRC